MITHEPPDVITGSDGCYTLRFERMLRHRPSVVWSALTEPGQVAVWFTAAAIEPGPGGRVDLDFGDEGAAVGEVTVWEPAQVFEHTWHEAGHESLVRWELTEVEAGTRLVLTHRGLLSDGGVDFAAGWQVFCDRLPVHLDGGDVSAVRDDYEELRSRYASLFTR